MTGVLQQGIHLASSCTGNRCSSTDVYQMGTVVFTILFTGRGQLYLLSCLPDGDSCIYYLVYRTGTVVFTILFTGPGQLLYLYCFQHVRDSGILSTFNDFAL